MNQESRELVLSRAELVYVLHALQTSRIVGMELKEFDLPSDQFDTLLEEAEQSLIDSSLLAVDEESEGRVLNPILVGMVGALAHRSLGIILIRGVRDKGQQLFVFNFYKDVIVEHTLPREGLHRLATLPTLEAFFERVDELVPLRPVSEGDRPRFSVTQAEFEKLRRLAQGHNGSSAKAQLMAVEAGLEEDLAPVLVESLRRPMFTLSVACLECEGDTAVDAHSVAIFANEQSAWGIWEESPDAADAKVVVLPTGINDVKMMIASWLGLGQEEKDTV